METGHVIPFSVSFISTYKCNIVCEHCDLTRFRERELATSEVRAMLEELEGLGVRSLTLEGGEPLTRPDIGELISFARSCSMCVFLVTNGTLVGRSLHRISGLSGLVVRLYWSDGFMDGGPVYARALEAAAAAKENGLSVECEVVLTRDNARALPAILDDCASLGVRAVFTRLVRSCHSSDNSRIGSVMPDAAELDAATKLVVRRKNKVANFSTASSIAVGAFSGSFSGGTSFVITPSGAVAPCFCLLTTKIWTNGLEEGFRKAINHASKFRCPNELADDSRLKACNG